MNVIENKLRQGRYADRIYSTASVYLAGVLEYLVNLLEVFYSYNKLVLLVFLLDC